MAIKKIESVRMEQPDRSEEEMALFAHDGWQCKITYGERRATFILCKRTLLRRII